MMWVVAGGMSHIFAEEWSLCKEGRLLLREVDGQMVPRYLYLYSRSFIVTRINQDGRHLFLSEDFLENISITPNVPPLQVGGDDGGGGDVVLVDVLNGQ